jgi:hypothetical protein
VNSFTGQRVQIGVSQQIFDELQKITDEYYNKLVEVGVIVPPKSNEDIIKEQQEMISKMYDAISKLTKKVEDLENGCTTNSETT